VMSVLLAVGLAVARRLGWRRPGRFPPIGPGASADSPAPLAAPAPEA